MARESCTIESDRRGVGHGSRSPGRGEAISYSTCPHPCGLSPWNTRAGRALRMGTRWKLQARPTPAGWFRPTSRATASPSPPNTAPCRSIVTRGQGGPRPAVSRRPVAVYGRRPGRRNQAQRRTRGSPSDGGSVRRRTTAETRNAVACPRSGWLAASPDCRGSSPICSLPKKQRTRVIRVATLSQPEWAGFVAYDAHPRGVVEVADGQVVGRN
jgi:hypothetical protein